MQRSVGLLHMLSHGAEWLTKKLSRTARLSIACPVEPGTYNVSHTVEVPVRILPREIVRHPTPFLADVFLSAIRCQRS